jgi:hypothetical protein
MEGRPEYRSLHRCEAVRQVKGMWGTIRNVVGVVLFSLGVAGLLLPVLPGTPLLLAGMALLGAKHPWVRPTLARLRWWRRKWKRDVSEPLGGRRAGR